ncbi:MAG: restriction endonuclease subunit S [Desulfobacteraceae bacterium]|nr:restriction endonuclease subunit S [Desulfobacteraceae bacterium]
MSADTTKVTLPDICDLVTDGTHDSPKLQSSGIPFIKGKHISSGRIDFANCDYITEQDHRRCIRRVRPQANDVLFSNIGSVGDAARVPYDIEFSIKNVALFRPNPEKINPLYFYYLVISPYFRGHFLNVRSGAAQPFISLENFRSLRFTYIRDKTAQQRIGNILSAYDDLIENNRRRIQLLKQAARLLYKEWFVHLRFPGHEHVKVKNGVPEGWEKKTAFDVMQVLSGGTPKTARAEYWNGSIPFFTPKDTTKQVYSYTTEKTLTENGLNNCNSKLYPKDTIFITARGTVGNINLAQTTMAMNQSCYALVAKPPLDQHFLYFALIEGVEQFRSRAVGAVFDAIIIDTFKLIPFVVPSEKLIKAFTENAPPIIRQIDILTTQNRKLFEAKDILLPRLMNGDITV